MQTVDNSPQARSVDPAPVVDTMRRGEPAALPAQSVNRIAFIDAAGRLGPQTIAEGTIGFWSQR